MKSRWVTFDCFGTLVDWNAGLMALLSPLAGPRAPELLRAYHEFEQLVEAERPHRLYKDVLVESLLRAADKTKVTLSAAQARALPQAWGNWPLFDDVEEMLAGLRDLGCRLAVLTNCDDDLFAQTHRCFRRAFDLVITAERVQDYKPSPSHFRYFFRSSGVELDHWVHVACSWHHDIAPARAMGVRRVWLDRENTGDDPAAASVRVRRASEVRAAVTTLLSPAGGD